MREGGVSGGVVGMLLYVHRNRRLIRGREPRTATSTLNWGWGGGGGLYTYRYTVTIRMTPALRWVAIRAV